MKALVSLALLAALGVLASEAPADAQARVRVTRDQTDIWRPGFILVEAIVQGGTELDVVARRDEWYEVVLPASATRPGTKGFIAADRVEPLGGSGGRADDAGRVRRIPGTAMRRPPPRPTLARRGIRGFGQAGYGRFAASQSFSSVLGSAGALWFGGGAEIRRGPWTFEGSLEHFQRTGERVFVSDGRVFRLGIPDTVTLVPVTGTAGYRRQVGRAWSVQAGGGMGRYFFKEASEVGVVVESFATQANSYHLRADLEWHRRGLVATAAEVQYTWVPGALSGGVASTVGERDMGGLQFRLKVFVGR